MGCFCSKKALDLKFVKFQKSKSTTFKSKIITRFDFNKKPPKSYSSECSKYNEFIKNNRNNDDEDFFEDDFDDSEAYSSSEPAE
eukprot:gene12193-14270_t